MKVYRIILAIILVITIAWGVWYCVSTYNEHSSDKKGILVQEEYAEYSIY
ncbi:MAG: hypothetical protein ACI4TK_03620 [Agathobacter sp.]